MARKKNRATSDRAVAEKAPPITDKVVDEVVEEDCARPIVVADEVVADEVVADEVVADEVVADEVVADEVVADEVVADEVVVDEVVVDEVVADEVVADEVVADDKELVETWHVVSSRPQGSWRIGKYFSRTVATILDPTELSDLQKDQIQRDVAGKRLLVTVLKG